MVKGKKLSDAKSFFVYYLGALILIVFGFILFIVGMIYFNIYLLIGPILIILGLFLYYKFRMRSKTHYIKEE